MKRILTTLAVVSIVLSSTVNAEEEPWPYICEQTDLNQFSENRYLMVSSSSIYPSILADRETIQIDKKKKMIKVWITNLASDEQRSSMIKTESNNGDYTNYGYDINLMNLDYGKMLFDYESIVDYTCNGKMILTTPSPEKIWRHATPGSAIELTIKAIMKKYNLK